MLEKAMGASLRLLNEFAGSEVAEKLGLVEPAKKILYQGSKTGFTVLQEGAKVWKQLVDVKAPERMPKKSASSDLFDLTPTEDQAMVQDTMRQFAADVLRPGAHDAESALATPKAILDQAQELGIMSLSIPEKLGGAGEERSPVSNVLIAEALAHGDMGMAFAILSPLSVINALVDAGSADQQSRYLAAFAKDTFLPASIALMEPQPMFDPFRLRTRAIREGLGYRLEGVKSMVALSDSAELFLVAAAVDGARPRIFLVDRNTPGLTIERTPAMGLRAAGLGELRLSGVSVSADRVLGGEGDAFDYASFVDRGRIAWSALAVGQAQALLDFVIPYCNERRAFGEPITNRQAVAFMIADMAIEVESMRMLTWRAAALAEEGKGCRREAYLARLLAGEKAMKLGSDGVQLLGGHGYTKEYPVERWYRNLRAVAVMESGLYV
ncbi:MAG: acyl-CoA dehydrogenase family protein [Polyangiales bacterium]